MKKLWLSLAAVVLGVLVFALYRFAGVAVEPVVVTLPPGPPQPKVSPEEAGIDMVSIQAAVDYAAPRNTRALLIGQGGHIVFEKYWDGSSLETPVDLSGFVPALAALAVGTALNDRLILSLDAPLSNYISEVEGKPEGAVTIRQLLSEDDATLGIAGSTDLLAQVLERVTHLPYQTIVAERLWRPLEGGDLRFEKRGGERRPEAVNAGCCLRVRLGDWMRVGEVLANDGVFEGNQLTPPRFVNLMLSPVHKDAARGYFTRVDGRFAAHGVARLEAAGKQRMWIVPSLRLVILRLGEEPEASKGWEESMIPDNIIRGTRGWAPASAGAGVDPNKYAPH